MNTEIISILKSSICFFATRIEDIRMEATHWILNGVCFANKSGFGWINPGFYSGGIHLISGNTIIKQTCSFSRIHIGRVGLGPQMGWRHYLTEIERIPEVPFLITTLPNVRPIYSREIIINPSAYFSEFIHEDAVGLFFSVVSENWFGVVDITRFDDVSGLASGTLRAYAFQDGITVSPDSDNLYDLESEDLENPDLFGRVIVNA